VTSDAGVQEQISQRTTTSAAQIDNETLRDQVQHLQKKSAKLEEQLEDARAALERDVSTYQEKIGRIRMEEEQRKRDLLSKSREVEQLIKSEARARGRVDEIEEALRESTVALENARGEVETLRAELAVR
jgi:CAP-Gly domain-containing linker protein 1